MSKILYLDTETTGLLKWKHEIIQLSGIIEIDGVEKEEFDFRLRPLKPENIEQSALDVNGIKMSDFENYESPHKVFKEFKGILNKYIDRYNKNDKFYMSGYNVGFDFEFIQEFFKSNNDNYFGSYFSYYKLDVKPLFEMLKIYKLYNGENIKLSSICDNYSIPIKAHDSLSDIRATKNLIKVIYEQIKDIDFNSIKYYDSADKYVEELF